MAALIPWARLEARIEPAYPKSGTGRRPYPLSVILRVHGVQLFYQFSDPAMADRRYDIESVRRFVGVRLLGPIPDATTILNFRHLLERHDLGRPLIDDINAHRAEQGLGLQEGTGIDASIIAAPPSTPNASGERDPEMPRPRRATSDTLA